MTYFFSVFSFARSFTRSDIFERSSSHGQLKQSLLPAASTSISSATPSSMLIGPSETVNVPTVFVPMPGAMAEVTVRSFVPLLRTCLNVPLPSMRARVRG